MKKQRHTVLDDSDDDDGDGGKPKPANGAASDQQAEGDSEASQQAEAMQTESTEQVSPMQEDTAPQAATSSHGQDKAEAVAEQVDTHDSMQLDAQQDNEKGAKQAAPNGSADGKPHSKKRRTIIDESSDEE